jgi:plasmid stability protein
MGQIIIRNLDDRIIETLKRRAEAAGRSMEAEAREALRRATRLTGEEKVALAREMHARTAHLLRDGEAWRDSWELIREDRDAVDDPYR